jgi:hypothetical protein
MGPETHAAGGGPERTPLPEPPGPADADILERALRGLKPWVRLAQGGLAALALLALFGAFRGLSAAQGSPATLQVGTLAVLAVGAGLIALVLCGLLGPVAGALDAPRPGSGPAARLEPVLIQHRAFWRQAGQWSVPLLALVAAAGGVFRFAAAPGSALAAPEPAPLFEDLDGSCGAVREQTLCFALARYNGGRLAARSDWMTIPVSRGEMENHGERLRIRAKSPDGVEWSFGFTAPREDNLREGLIHVAQQDEDTMITTWRMTFFPQLPPGMELPPLAGAPPRPMSTFECPRLSGRLRVDQLDLPPDNVLRAVRADFEHACLAGGGAWVAVGRFSFRRPEAKTGRAGR